MKPDETGRSGSPGAQGRSLHCPSRALIRRLLVNDAADLLFDHSTLQRASAVFRLHHVEPGADRHARRPAGRCGERELGGSWTLAPMATEIERQTVRWIAEFIGLPDERRQACSSAAATWRTSCASSPHAPRRRDWTCARWGCGRPACGHIAAAGLCLCRDPHLDSESRRSVRTGHRCHPMGSRRRAPAHEDRRASPSRSQTIAAAAIVRSSSSALRARSVPVLSTRFPRSRRSAASSICGSTSMARTAGWPRRFLGRHRPSRPRRRRLGRRRSAQVALCAAGGRLRAGAPGHTISRTPSRITRRTTSSRTMW